MHPIKHFQTITHHRHLVCRHCFAVGLYWQGLTHDLSKYSPTEFIVGARYYQGHRSPNNAEREATGVSRAWLHHKGRNKHHLEYWIDYGLPDGKITGMKMPVRYVVEMFCDRVAASKTYNKEQYTDADSYWYFIHSVDHYIMHPESKALLEQLLTMLKDQGEEKTFRYIRRKILHKR